MRRRRQGWGKKVGNLEMDAPSSVTQLGGGGGGGGGDEVVGRHLVAAQYPLQQVGPVVSVQSPVNH